MLAELLFQAAWVAVFLQGAQGRVYTGRRKLANFAVERRRIGPHVCLSGFGSGCCPGWILSPGSGQCTLPLCSFGCGSGFCIAPNICACRDGRQGVTCQDPPGVCGEYGCDLTCNHGGCQEVARVCPLGFSMTETANGVRCVDIDECLSASCEGLCVNTEGGFVCECGPGMQLAADRHSCQDTDECLATPCQQHCQNSIGSYQCSCHPGFYLHGNRHSCMDVNECRRPSEKRTCHHSCHNTLGSFMCSCHPGYRLSVDRVSCEGFSKTSLAPSPILQSLQQPPTLLLLSPESMGPVLPPRGSPPSPGLAPSSVPGTPSPSPLLPILSVLPPAASPTSTSPPRSSTLGTSFWPRTARPSLPVSPLPPPLLQKKVSPSLPPSPLTPSVPPDALPSACWHGGVLHENSSYWTESPCLNCSCEGGQVFCRAVTCEVSCSHPIPPAQGECCPSCTGCFYYGMSRVEGDVFSLSEENCTVCVCLAGNISCISPECTPSPCPSSTQTDCCPCQPAECHFRGQIYAEGTEFNPDGDDCTTCVCRQGEVECSFIPCPTPGCPREDWLLAPGQCCFTCRRTALLTGCFIDDNGIEFPVGQLWSPGDPCELCICQADGSVSCKRTDCLEMCPHPIRIPGQCCPDCSAGCTYAGKIFYNNETFPSVLDPCLSCICLLGSVACSPVDCVVFCTYPFHPEGECCPICHDCNYKGRKVINGHNFVPEDEPCVYCTCQLGEVSCEKKSCPNTCTEPFGSLTHCCLDCQNNEVMGCFIDDNGIEFPVGQLWSPGDPYGSVSCKRTDCLEMCPHPIRIPGQCCPDCSAGCTYAGKIFYNNETFPSVLDPCLSCICLLGSVACSPVDCVVFCTYPFHPEGECCPICHDCNYKGRKVINGHNFVPEDEPCVYCTCQLGEVSCEKKSCPNTCTEPFGSLTHCCLDCQNNEVMDDLASLENRLANPVLKDGASETALQTLQRGPMALVSDSHCSYCGSTPSIALLTPEVHPEASNASEQETPLMNPAALGNVGLHQTRPGEAIRLHLNEPPSIVPPSWLAHSAIPQIKPESVVPLINNPEGFGDPPGRSTGSSGTDSSPSSLYSRASRTTAFPTAARTSIPSTPANLKNSITALFQRSNTHNLPLPPPAETFSPSASSNLDSLQELPNSPTHITHFSLDQQNVGNNSKLAPSDENSLTDISP
ncbi:von Willebrand factor C and EGF domain-containing protein isoform 2-T2 [Liasis olivaceus]